MALATVAPQLRQVPFTGADITCPVCENRIDIIANVEISEGSSQKAGSNGFRDPVLTVHLNTKVVSIKINHECTVKDTNNG